MLIQFQPPAMCRVTSSLALNASRDGASTASLGNLFQCATTLWVKNFFLILLISLLITIEEERLPHSLAVLCLHTSGEFSLGNWGRGLGYRSPTIGFGAGLCEDRALLEGLFLICLFLTAMHLLSLSISLLSLSHCSGMWWGCWAHTDAEILCSLFVH